MKTLLFCTLLLAVLGAALSKRCKKHKYEGCKLSARLCICEKTRACINPFPYSSEKECLDDVRGRNDQCMASPCKNGVCTQVKHDGVRGWYCECAGSGFYGKRCQHRCPPGENPIPKDYPAACVMSDDIIPN